MTTKPQLVPRIPVPAPALAPLVSEPGSGNAIAIGGAARIRWKTLISEARTVWSKLHPEELAAVQGDYHRLAGLVQLRYRISREESDRQVKGFFSKHYPAA